MKLSIVIPVYNEADRLDACLEAISRQSVTPLEVIVVDNGSSDNSQAIVMAYDFVTLLEEPKQGVVHARNTGFDAAHGEIIGRIDADTILPTTWVEQLITIFKSSEASAVSGAPHYYDFALSNLADRIDYNLRSRLAVRMAHQNFLWGANMAIRRSVWQQVRSQLCTSRDLHEDFDLGIHIQEMGFKVDYFPKLVADVSSRRIDTGLVDYIRYTLVSPKTYAHHQLKSWRYMYQVLFACWFFYLPARLIYRAYDPAKEKFSINRLLTPTQARINPTVNVV
ncbi:MAG TPA: glycosyltransferase [Candidatus Saccharimonadales bacterium]|nr:glycosyltransferase [Candidatus Saccharimonadales bacterium]